MKKPNPDIPKRIRKQWDSLSASQRWFWTLPKSERNAYMKAKKEEEAIDEHLRSIR